MKAKLVGFVKDNKKVLTRIGLGLGAAAVGAGAALYLTKEDEETEVEFAEGPDEIVEVEESYEE